MLKSAVLASVELFAVVELSASAEPSTVGNSHSAWLAVVATVEAVVSSADVVAVAVSSAIDVVVDVFSSMIT